MIWSDRISVGQEYQCQQTIDLYKSPKCDSLVTQAAAGRYLRFLSRPDKATASAVQVCLCEDDYPGWLPLASVAHLAIAPRPYSPPNPSSKSIRSAIPTIIQFAQQAMKHPNKYLWGGTVEPDYDCSGLMQAAFASAGIVIPRDSYQQEAFALPVLLQALQLGDLIFFGTPDRATHVALYIGQGNYIHSSGVEHGRNGIGVDSLDNLTDPVSAAYHRQLRGAGRIVRSYHPAKIHASFG